ncbi:hypothetical protein [Pseudoroseicyclus sp. CXY001]|uniref:hypothetical protein n=1 Tax=Pseudoroseicyclus sp. CXY001 TaxID=3242492 RepID=UPI00358DD3CE
MRAIFAAFGAAIFLSGCGDPLSDIGRFDGALGPAATPGLVAPADELTGFGFLRGAWEGAAAEDPAAEPASAEPASAAAAPPAGRGGFLGGLFSGATPASANPGAEVANQVAPGTVLPWGEVGAICGLDRREMGSRMGAASGFEIWDPSGGATTAHTLYITGFSDGCARQVTAAMALFGDVGTYEFVRYSTPESAMPMMPTDVAYEAIKSSACGVPAGTPCGGRLDALDRRTTFLTLYQGFGSGASASLLLSNGRLAATDFPGGAES